MIVHNFNKPFFVLLIDKLNQSGIKYYIVGDYQNLPESVGHDVDFWTGNVKVFHKILEEVVKETGFHILIDNFNGLPGFNMAVFKVSNENELYLMKWDVFSSESAWKQVLPLKKLDGEVNYKPYKNFFVCIEGNTALSHFLYPMFEWGYIKKDEYKVDILKHYKEPQFKKSFKYLWGEKDSERVLKMIENEQWKEIEYAMPSLRRKAIVRGLFRRRVWYNICMASCGVIRRMIHPSGKVVAICGLDGAGKTTILDELNDIFVNLLKKKKVYSGYWRPYVLPEIRELLGKKNSKTGVDKEAQKGKTIISKNRKVSSLAVSLFKMLYYWIDYILAEIKYGSVHQRGGIVLFDRHYIDMIVYPQRFGMNLPRELMLFFYKFIPKPDKTFFLWCTPDEITARKQEYTKEEIQTMLDDYLEVGKNVKNFTTIHTNTTIEKEICEIIDSLVK